MISKLFTARKGFISEIVRRDNYRAKRDGFTLIELLIVVAIVSLLTSLSAAAFNSFNRRQRLDQAGKALDSVIRDAQTRALSSVDGLNWGVRLVLNQSTVELFSNDGLNHMTPNQSLTRDLGIGVVVSNLRGYYPIVDVAIPVNMIFSVLNGSVVAVMDDGTCLGGSADSACAAVSYRCLGIGINLQGTSEYRYLKVNERNIFESDTFSSCP